MKNILVCHHTLLPPSISPGQLRGASFHYHQVNYQTSLTYQLKRIQTYLKNQAVSLDGVVGVSDSSSLVASFLADQLHLPGPKPRVMYQIQQKALFMHHVKRVNPDQPETVILTTGTEDLSKLTWPIFVKPVRATTSVNAYKIDTPEKLHKLLPGLLMQRHDYLSWFEAAYQIFKKPADSSIHAFLAQPFVMGTQYTLDGFVYRGKVYEIGVTETVFDRTGLSFERFDFHSQLSQKLYEKLMSLAIALMSQIGFDNSGFNLEFFVTKDGKIVIIELNTRISLQFVPLVGRWYIKNSYEMMIDLCLGNMPDLRFKTQPELTSSCVLRRSRDGVVVRLPEKSEITRLKKAGYLFECHFYVEAGQRLSQVIQDSYSFRYAVLDIGGKTRAEILEKLAYVKQNLQFTFTD